MTYFIKQADQFHITPNDAVDIRTELPAATFTVKKMPMGGPFYLQQINDFEHKGKVYGTTPKTAERIFATFLDRPNSTGVLLSGEKGSGKTMLAKNLSEHARNQGMPTIVVNNPWHGEEFNTFMQAIEQPSVVIFDEFEKVYDKEQQASMLTLLDGIYPSKKMFVLTCNDKYRIDSHMKNRPGRLFYNIDYKGLEPAFVREYAQDVLINKDHVESVVNVSVVFPTFNFDMLKALVEEMNRYGESAHEALDILNAKPDSSTDLTFDIALIHPSGVVVREADWSGNPLDPRTEMGFYFNVGKKRELKVDEQTGRRTQHYTMEIVDHYAERRTFSDEDTEKLLALIEAEWDGDEDTRDMFAGIDEFVEFTGGEVEHIDAEKGEYVLVNEDGYRLAMRKQKVKSFSWNRY